ncbi:MAG: hypothetical protein ACRD3V_22455 [Vicinamibacteria bacterium]
MKIFGKSLGEYLRFQKPILIAILVVGLLRLILSLAGLPIGTVRWLSMTLVVLIGVIYYGIQVPRTGFGTYRHLLPLVFVQAALSNGIAILGILIAMVTGQDNVFTSPEFGGQGAFHLFGHVVFGTGIGSILSWAIASLVMFITKKVTRRSAAATS